MKKPSLGDARSDIAEPRNLRTRRSADPAAGIFAQEIAQEFADAREAACKEATKEVWVNGKAVTVPYPFPSPVDWRDCSCIF